MQSEGGWRGAIIDRYDESEQIFDSKLRIALGHQNINIDARPSDAILLAVVCQAPIYIVECGVGRNYPLTPVDRDFRRTNRLRACLQTTPPHAIAGRFTPNYRGFVRC